MKTTLLLLPVFLLTTLAVHAQIDKGRVQIGGDLNFNNQHFSQSSNSINNYTSLIIRPSIGRFYATNQLAGLFLNFVYAGNYTGKTYTYGGGVYFRQYKQVVKSLYVFAEEQGGFNYNRYTNFPSVSSPVNSYSISLNLRPGIAYDLTKRMQLEMAYNNLLSVSYNYSKDNQIFSLNSSLEGSAFQNLLVGFRFYLK